MARLAYIGFLLLAIVAACSAIACGGGEEAEEPTRPVETAAAQAAPSPPESFEFVMGSGYYPPAELALPDKGVLFADPDFHTGIVRFTDRETDGYSGPGISNEYAKADPENSDGTLVVLRGNDGEWYIYDRETLRMSEQLAGEASADEAPEFEPRWDAADPSLLYFLHNSSLMSYDISTGSVSPVHDFSDQYPQAAYITSGSEGDASLDRRYWCFMVGDSDGNVAAVVTYDPRSDEIVGRLEDPGEGIDYVSMDMSGSHCIIGWDERSAQVFTRDFSGSVDMPEGVLGHADFAFTADGRDVLVYQNTATDWIAMADLDSGEETNLLQIPFDVNTDIGLHFSGNSSQTPGWVLVSTYGSKNPPPDEEHSWMDTQLFMVELKASPRIWRLAHTQSYTSIDYEGEKNYFAEAYAAINTAGTRVYWASNWGNMEPEYSEVYVARLPDGWISSVP